MLASLSGMPIIDVDTHFSEPPDLWTSRAPRKLAERAPRVVRTAGGVDQWVVDGKHVFGPLGFCVIRKNASKEYGRLCLDTYEELHPGASQAKPRLAEPCLVTLPVDQEIAQLNTLLHGIMVGGNRH